MTTDENPDQSRIWNAYGHALGAAIGLEQVMRWANFHRRTLAILANETLDGNSEAKKQKLVANALDGTFGQIVSQFRQLHPEVEEGIFGEAIENGIEFRNVLSHRFLARHSRNLRTERGLDIIAIECNLYRDHFQRLEEHIRQKVDIDWRLVDASIGPFEDDPPHPLEEFL